MPSKAAAFTRKKRPRLADWLFGVPAIVFGTLIYSYVTLPDVRTLVTHNPDSTAFMDIRAAEARAQGKAPRRSQRWVKYGRISQDLKRAVLVAEDDAFWQHDGVDYNELQKSIELDWARGQLVRGASTITQQLAKNLYLSPSRNPERKLRELIIARRLEAELRKTRIFELYLNVIEWGDGVYGAEAAAHEYFGTSAAALGAVPSALLAGAIVNPRLLNPAHPTPRLLRRQQIILKRMGAVSPPAETPAASPPPDTQDAPAAPIPETAPAIIPPPSPADSSPESLPPAPPQASGESGAAEPK